MGEDLLQIFKLLYYQRADMPPGKYEKIATWKDCLGQYTPLPTLVLAYICCSSHFLFVASVRLCLTASFVY